MKIRIVHMIEFASSESDLTEVCGWKRRWKIYKIYINLKGIWQKERIACLLLLKTVIGLNS